MKRDDGQKNFPPEYQSIVKMVEFERYTLDNGLKVIIHEDRTTPIIAMNIVYRAGSAYEHPGLTGIAHLMEHLMFSGSVNVPEFDTQLQLAGGENNAYTNNDVADFYLTIPAENFETALWLESDRMLGPAFSQRSLDIQKKVVSEEFRQRYLNQPYGDAMLLLRPVAYTKHPYRWPTIGIDVSHIERTDLSDVKSFFSARYSPVNAILTIAGNISSGKALDCVNRWFGNIPRTTNSQTQLPEEPVQSQKRTITVERDVPSNMLYKAWHVCRRQDDDFRTLDLLSDILAGGESGRLYEKLVREKKMFSEINAYLTGDLDPGLLIFYGKLMNGTDIFAAETEITTVINEVIGSVPAEKEMDKVRNRFESTTLMSNINVLNKALNLSGNELIGDAGLINSEVESYRKITSEQAADAAKRYLSDENSTVLYYKSAAK